MNFDEWIQYGIEQGWCGPPLCYTHDGLPMTMEEDDEFEEGHDPCISIIRLYEDDQMKKEIEESHGPSSWRNFWK